MNPEYFISTYGYWGVLIGTFLEGETILVLGGFIAHEGHLKLPWVVLAAFLGTLSWGQLFFYIGRNYGAKILSRRPAWQARVERMKGIQEKFQNYLILLFRFLYGLRTLTPFVLGLSRVSSGRFLLLNTMGALGWAIAIGTGGYLFGHALETLIGDLKQVEAEILGVVVLAGIVAWIIHLYRRRRSKTSPP